MQNRQVGRVEDYTGAFAVSVYVLIFSVLMTLWALLGYPPTLFVAAVLHAALSLFERRAVSLARRGRSR